MEIRLIIFEWVKKWFTEIKSISKFHHNCLYFMVFGWLTLFVAPNTHKCRNFFMKSNSSNQTQPKLHSTCWCVKRAPSLFFFFYLCHVNSLLPFILQIWRFLIPTKARVITPYKKNPIKILCEILLIKYILIIYHNFFIEFINVCGCNLCDLTIKTVPYFLKCEMLLSKKRKEKRCEMLLQGFKKIE